jgi:hypothetical protein
MLKIVKQLERNHNLHTISGPMSNNPRIALYREAISLEEQRSRLQADLDRLTSRLNAIQSELFTGEESSPTTASMQVSTIRRAGGRSRRGELKAQVLSALVAAGNSGVRVKDLAAAIGTKPANIYSWFQSAPKRIPQIKKIGEAQYRLEGSLPDSALAAPAPKPVRGRAGRRRSTRPLSKRGELASRIIEGLKAAGKEGVKVRQLADDLGVKHKNLFIWFATTGKKNKSIKKVGEAHYRYEG